VDHIRSKLGSTGLESGQKVEMKRRHDPASVHIFCRQLTVYLNLRCKIKSHDISGVAEFHPL
jgi:hypothetical protein